MAGRKQKPYQTSWGEIIPGLAKDTSGRWRIAATGHRWTEPDERRALQKYRDWQGTQGPATVRMAVAIAPVNDQGAFAQALNLIQPNINQTTGNEPFLTKLPTTNDVIDFKPNLELDGDTFKFYAQRPIQEAALWSWFRKQLIESPENAAKMTGIPELAQLRNMPLPRPSIKLAAIRSYYETQNTSKDKAPAFRVFDQMTRHTGARTLADLTKDVLHSYRQLVENDPNIKSGGTASWMYGKIKAVIAFAQKSHDLDGDQIAAALERCKVLWSAKEIPEYQPSPIERNHLHKLLVTAGASQWRAWILMGLNCAMYIEELCNLEWKHLDLAAGTLSMRRAKTKFPRAATLWPETIAALETLRNGPTFVFTSPQGTKFKSSQSRCNEFRKLCSRAKLPTSVSFAALKDGAFTAAARGTAGDGRIAKILAGHSSGLEDAYILRDPKIVRPACDAVYAEYGPFTTA